MISKALAPIHGLSKLMSRKGLYPFLEREFASIAPGQRVLSVGAGGEVNRRLLSHMQTGSFNVIQLDIAIDRNPDLVADICEWVSPDPFDIIVISEVLEHVHSPRQAVQNLRMSLKDQGRIVVSVPFIFPIHDAPYDYYRYTRHGLEFLFADFNEVCIEERNNWGEALCVLLSRLVKVPSKRVKLMSPVFVLMALLAYPFLWGSGKLFPTPFLTTGYILTACK